MESTLRTLAKAISWQISGFIVMTAVSYAVTGSLAQGGAVAAIGCATGLVSYFAHEKVWSAISWGRIAERSCSAPARA